MSEFLETTVDKFTFKVATDRLYTAEGIWAKAEGNRVRIGLSDFLQQRSGDVAFAEVKAIGTEVAFGDEIAAIETIKVNISLSAPVTGKLSKSIRPWPALRKPSTRIPMGPAGWQCWSQRLGGGQGAPAGPAGLFCQDEIGSGAGGQKRMTMEKHSRKVVIVPCSGIGKTYGTVSREAAYEVTEDLRPQDTQLVALSMLVLGDEVGPLRGLREPGHHHRWLQAGLRQQDGQRKRRHGGAGDRRPGCVPPLQAVQAPGDRRTERRRAETGTGSGRRSGCHH